MQRTMRLMATVGVLALGLGTMACQSGKTQAVWPADSRDAQPRYLAHNLWFENPEKVYSTNYHVGAMLPAGTEVRDVAMDRHDPPKKIFFTIAETGQKITIRFMHKHHGMVTPRAYCDRLFTDKPFDELTRGLPKGHIEAIRAGAMKIGMTREATIIAYGYPIESYTPSIDARTWTFMRNRFRRIVVEFDDKGRLSREFE